MTHTRRTLFIVAMLSIMTTLIGRPIAQADDSSSDLDAKQISAILVSELTDGDVSNWVSLVANYFGALQAGVAAADLLGLMQQQDLASQIRDVVSNELAKERDFYLKSYIDSISQTLFEIQSGPLATGIDVKIQLLDSKSSDLMAVTRNILEGPFSFAEIYRIAPLYQIAVILHATALKLESNAETNLDAVIKSELNEALQVHYNLIGSHFGWCTDHGVPWTFMTSKFWSHLMPLGSFRTDCAQEISCHVISYYPYATELTFSPACFVSPSIVTGVTTGRMNPNGDQPFCDLPPGFELPDPNLGYPRNECQVQLSSVNDYCVWDATEKNFDAFMKDPVVSILYANLQYLEMNSDDQVTASPRACAAPMFLGDTD